jgi:hypothetical protein
LLCTVEVAFGLDVVLLAAAVVVVGGAAVDGGTATGVVTAGVVDTTAGPGGFPWDGAQAITRASNPAKGISIEKRDKRWPPPRTPGTVPSC